MSKTYRFTETLVDYIDTSIKHSTIGFASNNKLWLNGGSGPGGGSGMPPGGIIGQLIQRRVTYDTTESGRMCIEPSGSLLDNLNRIRWWQKPARWFEASPQNPRSMKVEIGSGIWYYDENLFLDFPGGESPTITLPTVNPRLDVVYVTESGVIGVQEGAEAADPVITMPTASGVLPIWAIYVTPTTAQIGWPCESYSGYLQEDIRPFIAYPGGGGAGVVDASYVVIGLDPTLTDERVLAAGVGISITDGGAGGNVVIAVVASGIDHGGLSGLADDDHPQYLLIDGSRAMASAANLLPTDAVGQELGAAGTRWDMFARNIDMADGGWIGNAVDDLRIIFLEGDSIEIRTDDANLYTFNENPSAATPMSATAAVFNITGGDDGTGQDAGLWLRNEETNVDWSIFIDKSDYDHLKIARNATIVAEFDTTGNFIMCSGNDIDPESAAGQNLGSSLHRWDLYTSDININNGGVIHCTTLGGPVITFNSITDLLGFTECRVSIGHNTPIVALDIDHPNINYNGILLASGTPVGVLGMIKFTGLDFFGYTPSGWLSLTAEGGGGGVGNHNLLSAVHIDTVAAACVRGYIIRGNATPKWERYDAATAGAVLIGDGNDIISDTTPTFVGLVTLNASLTFAGGGGANAITVPDNVADALHVVDAGGLEYTRIVSTDANPYYLIDPAAASVKVGIGIAVPDFQLHVEGPSALFKLERQNSTGVDWAPGMYMSRTRDAGADIQSGDYLGKFQFVGTVASTEENFGAFVFISSNITYPRTGYFAFLDADIATKRMVIWTTGNVGIGTDTPDNPLELLSTTTPQFRITHTDATDYATFSVDGDGQLDITTADGGGAGGHICLMPDGSVGIATLTPSARVTIADDANIPPLNVTERSGAPAVPVAGDIYLDDGTNTASSDPGWRRYTGAAWEDISAGAGGAGYWSRDAGNGYTYTSNIGDRVGIGTITPDAFLEVVSSTVIQLRLTHTDNTDYVTFAVDGDGQLDITTVDGGGAGGHICLIPDGYVGIGTLTPTALLDLDGAGPSFHFDLSGAGVAYLYTQDATSQLAITNEATGGDVRIYATEDIYFRTSSVDPAMIILKSGNVGIGTTDVEAWATMYAIEALDTSISFGTTTDTFIALNSNSYYDGGADWKYKTTDEAARYYIYQGAHYWHVAASGTIDTAITWIDAMTITVGGWVGIGEATPAGILELKTTGTTHCHLYIDAPTNYDAGIILQENNVTKWYIINDGNRSDEFAIGSAAANDVFVSTQAGVIKIPNLAGAGVRNVVAAADGTLSAP